MYLSDIIYLQLIINKSCWHAMVTKITLQIDDIGKIPQISEDIKSMMRSNSKVFLEKEPPFCFLSRIERSYGELTLGCSLKHMVYFLSSRIVIDCSRLNCVGVLGFFFFNVYINPVIPHAKIDQYFEDNFHVIIMYACFFPS